MFQNVLSQVLVLFLIVLVGAAARKFNAVGEQFNKYLNDFILNISLPALIISSMRIKYTQQMAASAALTFVLSSAMYALSIGFAYVATYMLRIKDDRKNIFRFMLIFSNTGFMGYPVIKAIFGDSGMLYASIFNLVFTIIAWTAGVIIINGGRKDSSISLKNIINPGTAATIAGLLIFLFSIKLPQPIFDAIDLIGSTATPLSMILIGFMLGNSSIRQIFSSPMVFLMSLLRLLVIPIVFLLILRPIIKDSLVFGVSVIMMAMPAASLMQIFTGKYGADEYTSSQCIFVSTLMSILTIPLIAILIKS